ncbi:unnamed protein product [Ostreobium quekettii]|uniref:Uncharacterized protein n=1 Tax=Ostreobium quekettii TaxID=121088 RepID=A0A8S1IV32_9CHLO|nr:unnamed protein product [Ostreobium quekettii]
MDEFWVNILVVGFYFRLQGRAACTVGWHFEWCLVSMVSQRVPVNNFAIVEGLRRRLVVPSEFIFCGGLHRAMCVQRAGQYCDSWSEEEVDFGVQPCTHCPAILSFGHIWEWATVLYTCV